LLRAVRAYILNGYLANHDPMSTWNVGNYHWEEQNCNVWARAGLNELVNAVALDGWIFRDFNFPTITAARSIRKNREFRPFEICLTFNGKLY
jgi:hypothetical protein